ncbi:hypothetical protein ACHQM5_017982 [Ranunculus cassubicifolius]
MDEEKLMWVKLLIDKEKNRVIFAECEQDFIDVLFSFFTLPLGTIIKLANKKSNLGCMDTLYHSVETLDIKHFQTHACKEMLLNPKSASEFITQNLVVNLDGVDPKVYYLCPNWKCSTEIHCLASIFKNAKCCCGMEMTQRTDFVDDLVKGEVFVKGFDRFMVTDDLCVLTISMESSMGLVDMLRNKEGIVVDEMIVAVGLNEVVELLKCSLVSTKPMSDVFLLNQKFPIQAVQFHPPHITIPSSNVHSNSKRIQLKLWIRKSTNKVLFAEAKEDFLNLLFSFLAFPLGYVVKFLGRYSLIGSTRNLYKSVQDLCAEHPLNFTEDKDHLLDPQIAHHFGWHNQLINIEEASWETEHLKCITCFNMKVDNCSHGAGHSTLHLINPKFPYTVTKQGGGFVNNSVVFMVTDELVVEPFSWMESISIANKLSVPCNDIEVRITDVGGEEVKIYI